jgi:tryptophanyl-tRNA synthetase
VDCKRPLIDAIQKELAPIALNLKDYEDDKNAIAHLVTEGAERARDEAQKTLKEVREVMGIEY